MQSSSASFLGSEILAVPSFPPQNPQLSAWTLLPPLLRGFLFDAGVWGEEGPVRVTGGSTHPKPQEARPSWPRYRRYDPTDKGI